MLSTLHSITLVGVKEIAVIHVAGIYHIKVINNSLLWRNHTIANTAADFTNKNWRKSDTCFCFLKKLTLPKLTLEITTPRVAIQKKQ